MKILMICLGNICRSPLAEGILAHKIKEHQLDWQVDSCGTYGGHTGESPDPRSIEVAARFGVNISKQKARKFRSTDIDEFDVLYVMDKQNYADVIAYCHADSEREKVQQILGEITGDAPKSVPDPYYGGPDGFLHVYKLLDDACDRIIEKYK